MIAFVHVRGVPVLYLWRLLRGGKLAAICQAGSQLDGRLVVGHRLQTLPHFLPQNQDVGPGVAGVPGVVVACLVGMLIVASGPAGAVSALPTEILLT